MREEIANISTPECAFIFKQGVARKEIIVISIMVETILMAVPKIQLHIMRQENSIDQEIMVQGQIFQLQGLQQEVSAREQEPQRRSLF